MQVPGVKIDNAKGAKGYKKRFFTNFSAWIFARTEQKLEQYRKIKDNDLSFWVNELMSFWTDEFVSWWVCELMSFWTDEFLSWWVRVLMILWVDEFLNWWVRELGGMSSGVIELSLVYKSVSGLVLHLSQFIEILKAETTS